MATPPRSSAPPEQKLLDAALQQLPGRQRAVLILRDVLGLRGDLVAEITAFATPEVFPWFGLPAELPP